MFRWSVRDWCYRHPGWALLIGALGLGAYIEFGMIVAAIIESVGRPGLAGVHSLLWLAGGGAIALLVIRELDKYERWRRKWDAAQEHRRRMETAKQKPLRPPPD